MEDVEIVARSLEAARRKAAERLGVAPEEVDVLGEYEPDEADLETLKKEEMGLPAEERQGEATLYIMGVGVRQFVDHAQQWVGGLMNLFQPGTAVEVVPDEGNLRVVITASQDASIIIGRDGSTLNALQHICNRILPRMSEDFPHVVLDIGDYLDRKHERLSRIAKQAVRRARQSNGPVALKPMPSGDRKYIHNLLKEYNGLSTHSEGREPRRYIVIEFEDKSGGARQGRGGKKGGGGKRGGGGAKSDYGMTQPLPPPPPGSTDEDYDYEDTDIEEHGTSLPPYKEVAEDDDTLNPDRPLVDEIE